MNRKPELAIISCVHTRTAINPTLENLRDAGVGENSLVMIEPQEPFIRDPSKIEHLGKRGWVVGILNFLKTRNARIVPLEPVEVRAKRMDHDKPLEDNRNLPPWLAFLGSGISEEFNDAGRDLAMEEILTDVIREKMKCEEKGVVVVGDLHGPRLYLLLKREFDAKLKKTRKRDTTRETAKRSIKKAILEDRKQFFWDGEKKAMKPIYMKIGKAAYDYVKNTPWTMPPTLTRADL